MKAKHLNIKPIDKEHFEQRVEQYKKMRLFVDIKELFMIATCLAPFALCVNRILVPHAIVGGGLTGFCEILYFATDGFLPIWLTSMCINAALLITAIIVVGWKFCVRTIFGVVCLTLWLKFIPIAEIPAVSDPFMAVILAGIFNGVGLGLVFLNNGSSGGTDVIAMIVNKFKHLPMGRALFFCDLVIISCAWFLPQVTKVEQLLFGLCYTFMSTTAVDWVMNRVRQSVQFFIFSQKYEEIAEAIMTQIPRGVTILEGEGGYTKKPIKIITVLAKKNESSKIFRLVRQIDPEAFVSESQTEGVFGRGFESIKTKA